MMLTVFELITVLAVLGLGFVLGRIWEIRQQEILRGNVKGRLRDTDSTHSPALGCGLPIGSRKPHRPQTYLQRLIEGEFFIGITTQKPLLTTEIGQPTNCKPMSILHLDPSFLDGSALVASKRWVRANESVN